MHIVDSFMTRRLARRLGATTHAAVNRSTPGPSDNTPPPYDDLSSGPTKPIRKLPTSYAEALEEAQRFVQQGSHNKIRPRAVASSQRARDPTTDDLWDDDEYDEAAENTSAEVMPAAIALVCNPTRPRLALHRRKWPHPKSLKA